MSGEPEFERVIEHRIEIDDEWLERLIVWVADAVGKPAAEVTAAVEAFLLAETSDLEAINAVLALGVHLRPGGPNDGAGEET